MPVQHQELLRQTQTKLVLAEEAPIDPNEPLYCVCRQVAYGGMVACDNDDCPTEWFHFACVGLKETVRVHRDTAARCKHAGVCMYVIGLTVSVCAG